MRCAAVARVAKRDFGRRGPPRLTALRDHAAEESLGRDADPGATAAPAALLFADLISTTT
jgi:hypothetical protein